jgi:hypothetical protein
MDLNENLELSTTKLTTTMTSQELEVPPKMDLDLFEAM